ncbi:hypothetical protein Sango_2970500 [Sesamum angolense]|uniref:Uncharacterized protein n=1 Tax=Sesamum angolense TaxID=2727404 RepID=A0AAE1T559_9LAMI|nr:hypothetical protein Sango_2970500 [Sesamum angolense]
MFRRDVHSNRRKNWWNVQIPSYLSSRRPFSVSPKNEPIKPDSGGGAPEPQSRLPKVLAGGLALGSVFLAAYYYGALDRYVGKEQQRMSKYTNAWTGDKNTETPPEQQNAYLQARELSEAVAGNSPQGSDESSSDVDHARQDVQTHSQLNVPEESIRTGEDKGYQAKDMAVLAPQNVDHVEGGDLPNVPQSSMPSDDVTSKPAEQSFDLKSPQAVQDDSIEKSSSLLDDYYLRDKSEESVTSSSKNLRSMISYMPYHLFLELKDISSSMEDLYDGFITKDGKLVLDFLQAIHAAEERQAELDAHFFAEEKRAMKEKYEKELKDARVRELMYAEREAILDKELNKERVKAAAALKSLQEKLEEKLKTELEQKEMEVEQKLKQMQDISKAELTAAIAREKASQIEKMAEANLHINALCMAFYARSEEARQTHSVHKLALGALALEDALGKGLPIKKEIEALHTHVEGIDDDSLIALFDALKGTLRHFSLIPQAVVDIDTFIGSCCFLADSMSAASVASASNNQIINKMNLV